MRADARRNQVLILEAARAEISRTGSDVSMVSIAKAAGVAVGTLYRHYPTKTDLVQAVLVEFSRTLVDWAVEAGSHLVAPGDAMDAIGALIRKFVAEASNNQAIKDAARVLDAGYMTPELEDRGLQAVNVLVETAIKDSDLRSGVTAADIYLLMLSAPSSLPKALQERWLKIILDGLQTARRGTDD